MAQRVDQLFRWFYGVESTEGTEVLGAATEALLLVGEPAITKDQIIHAREFQGQMGFYTGRVGHQPDPVAAMIAEWRNRGATSNVPDADELYKTVFGTRTLDTIDTTATGTPTSTVIDTVSSSGATAGNAAAFETATADEYEIGWIKSISSNELTLENALTFTPASGKKVKSSLTFAPNSAGHQTLSFQKWLDATDYLSLLGCMGSMMIDIPETGGIPLATFAWSGQQWAHRTSGTRPSQTIGDTGSPPRALGGIFKIDAAKTDLIALSVDMAQTIGRKTSHNSIAGTFAELVVNRKPVFGFTTYNVDQARYTTWNAGTEVSLEYQLNNSLFNMVAMRVPKAQYETVVDGNHNGMMTDVVSGRCNITSGDDEFRIAFA